jgi:hypothetical protein
MRIKLTFYLTYENVVGLMFDINIYMIIGSWERHNLSKSLREILSCTFIFLGQFWCNVI